MRSVYIALAAALCWTGTLSASPAGAKDDVEVAMMAGRRRLTRTSGRYRSEFAALGARQGDQQCGAQFGRCPGDLCCSSYGFCGDSVDHCHPLFDCQTQYGTCGWPRAVPTTSARPTTSSTPAPPTTTTPSSTSVRPPTTSTSVTIPVPSGGLEVTQNGMCGNNTMCIGNPNYGPCCSQFFWCGSSIEFCGAGCQSDFGACLGIPGQPGNPITNGTTTSGGGSGPTSSPPTTRPTSTRVSTTTTTTTSSRTTSSSPSVTLPAGQTSSTDGRCGNNVNCLGSRFGRCCSQFGYCGDGDQYCPYIVGCQPQFGYCDPQ
ncbi:hypothetical protein CHGG_06796 [Chaetomium globosum CBS 148.51]|uniref:Chitin-binding type-1 domain-containing protein n=1 Tax=Chaetomium globosum (strain ATCC 6205 / CBS 148.51 / DSM 1962 / NBRC 6347 / NRRL 1970) TaxID=306901 RepID=Q2H3G9_CHAGB|nr:uncharacterized protein CHGG_06796 [Chaetomium globosum CBS 148.51]EAQ90177.1 hypothetical protein CHGG_06796 [Chaetomium globosum CBS 148.51]